MSGPSISLEQWRALIAVVEAGGYGAAAERLSKSQSAVTYAVQKIETQLGVKAFEPQGRRSVLTPTGEMLYRRARALVAEASDLERAAARLSAGWEAELWLAVEILFPTGLLLESLTAFGRESPSTRIEVVESVLGGTSDALRSGKVDLAVTPSIPSGFVGTPLLDCRLVAVTRCDHPLQALGRTLVPRDLRGHRHVVVRDSGGTRSRGTRTVEVDQRWTVSNLATSVAAVRDGHGFAWLPEGVIRADLQSGRLKALPLTGGGVRHLMLYLVIAEPELAGPGVQRLAEILRSVSAREDAILSG